MTIVDVAAVEKRMWEEMGHPTAKELMHEVYVSHLYAGNLKHELSTLNEVIARRKRATRQLRDRLDEAKSYHSPNDNPPLGDGLCQTCGTLWPCPTYIALQPSVLNRTEEKGK